MQATPEGFGPASRSMRGYKLGRPSDKSALLQGASYSAKYLVKLTMP